MDEKGKKKRALLYQVFLQQSNVASHSCPQMPSNPAGIIAMRSVLMLHSRSVGTVGHSQALCIHIHVYIYMHV